MRSLLGKLRIGLAEQSLLQALSQACAHTPPNYYAGGGEYPPGKGFVNAKPSKDRIDEIALAVKTTYW